MRVLVTGAEGVVGGAVVPRLLADGCAVTTLTLPDATPHDGVDVVRGDARDADAVARAVAGADAVVHLAAVADPLFRPEPLLFANNTQATFTVLWTAAEAGVRRLVVAGSVNAIGLPFNPHRPLPRRYPLDETVVPDLADPYSLAKHVDEATLRAVCRRFGATGVVLRLPLMIPPGREREIVARSWEDAGRAAAEGWGWLSTTDGAEAFARALRVPVDGVRVVQLAARNNVLGVPTEDLLERYAPDVPHPPFVGREAPIDTRRAAALLGFEPRQADPLPAQG